MFDSLPTGLPHVRDGRLRALGVTSLKATPLAPGVPPIADVLPGYESTTWFGVFGPRGLPPEVVSRVNAAANQVLKDPEVVDRLQRLGIEPVGGTPAQFTTMLASESAKWKKIITERKITLD
jgi:tripartite-type tricarboxylate transporter receptor subunit TctC